MNNWIVEPELVACAVIALLLCFSREKRLAPTLQSRIYRACLFFALFSIALNIITIALLRTPGRLPYALNYLLNLLYFIFVGLMELALTLYVMYLIQGRNRCFARAVWVCGALQAAFLALAATNHLTGLLFTLEDGGAYRRGPGNRAIYLLLVAYSALVAFCYLRQRREVSRQVRRVIRVLPLVALLMGMVQYCFPDVMMSGSVMACILLVLFLNFQSRRQRTDSLTGLGSREGFFDTAEQLFARGRPFYCIGITLRHFSEVNNKLGHTGGDQVLCAVAEYLEAFGRRGNVCRLDGAEFALLLPDQEEEAGAALLRRLADRFAQPWLQGKNIRLEARLVGVRCPEHGKDANELALHLEYGDMQLKKQPGTCLMCFGDDEQAALQRRNEVKALIERSMAQGGFEVVFQPIYDCAKKRFCTAEALLRLRDEQGEPVRPDEFIPLAEEFGLIVELDWMVLELVCGFLQQNPDLPIEAVSVNFSVQQFEEQDAAGRVLRTLARHGITPSRLKLELTERVLARDLPRTSRVLQQLCDGGVGLYLDDFGTGYSNLASVARLPLEAVKIGKSLLVEAQKSPETALLLDAVVRTFHTMGRRVVLEGLESAGQLRRIAGLPIDAVQGYFYARPMPGDQYRTLLLGQAAQV